MKEKDITTHVVLVTAVIKKGNTYLVAQRSKDDPQTPLVWFFPGGKVDLELGKSIVEKTLRREVMEEVGIEIKNIRLIENNGFIRVSGHHVIALTFLCDYLKGRARPLEGQEKVLWGTLEEIGKLNDKDFFQNILKSIKYFSA